jgi:hypothetical protein
MDEPSIRIRDLRLRFGDTESYAAECSCGWRGDERRGPSGARQAHWDGQNHLDADRCEPVSASTPAGISPCVSRPHDLHDYEYAALRQLQQGALAPHAEHPVWSYLLATDLVWIDWEVRPPAVRLTLAGRSYPTD